MQRSGGVPKLSLPQPQPPKEDCPAWLTRLAPARPKSFRRIKYVKVLRERVELLRSDPEELEKLSRSVHETKLQLMTQRLQLFEGHPDFVTLNKMCLSNHTAPETERGTDTRLYSQTRLPVIHSARVRDYHRQQSPPKRLTSDGEDPEQPAWVSLRERVERKRRQRLWLLALALQDTVQGLGRLWQDARVKKNQKRVEFETATRIQRSVIHTMNRRKLTAALSGLLSKQRFLHKFWWRIQLVLRIVRKRIAVRRVRVFVREVMHMKQHEAAIKSHMHDFFVQVKNLQRHLRGFATVQRARRQAMALQWLRFERNPRESKSVHHTRFPSPSSPASPRPLFGDKLGPRVSKAIENLALLAEGRQVEADLWPASRASSVHSQSSAVAPAAPAPEVGGRGEVGGGADHKTDHPLRGQGFSASARSLQAPVSENLPAKVTAMLQNNAALGLDDVKQLLEDAKLAFFRRELRRKRRHFVELLRRRHEESVRASVERLGADATRLDAFMAHPVIKKLAGIVPGDEHDAQDARVRARDGRRPVLSSLMDAQVLRTEIQQHKHAMAECLVIIGDRIAEANLAAQRQEELMTQRRVKTMAWRNRRLHVMELQESQANRARLQAEAEARRVQRLQQRQRLAEEEEVDDGDDDAGGRSGAGQQATTTRKAHVQDEEHHRHLDAAALRPSVISAGCSTVHEDAVKSLRQVCRLVRASAWQQARLPAKQVLAAASSRAGGTHGSGHGDAGEWVATGQGERAAERGGGGEAAARAWDMMESLSELDDQKFIDAI